LVTALVEECSRTLDLSPFLVMKSLVRPFHICNRTNHSFPFPVEQGSTSVDLSKAVRLKDVAFCVNSWGVDWITTALRTITPKHQDLRQISISTYFNAFTVKAIRANVRQTIGEHFFEQWLGLDRTFAQLSRSIHLELRCYAMLSEEKDVSDCMGCLLPETRGRQTIDLVHGYRRRQTQGARGWDF